MCYLSCDVHVFEPALRAEVFVEEAGGDAFSCVCVDVDEPADDCVDDDDEDDIVPPGEVEYAFVGVDVGEEVSEGGEEDGGCESVVFHGVVSSDEDVGVDAEVVAGSAGVAEGEGGEVDVAVGVGADQVEEVAPAAAFVAGGA